MKGLNEFSKQIYEGNKLRGFDVSKENIGQTLMLVVSELSEALEADRKGRKAEIEGLESGLLEQHGCSDKSWFKILFENHIKDTFEDEIADVAIRLFDLCGGKGIDIEKHIELKMKYNQSREYKHGKKY